jgi:hypothetical protein
VYETVDMQLYVHIRKKPRSPTRATLSTPFSNESARLCRFDINLKPHSTYMPVTRKIHSICVLSTEPKRQVGQHQANVLILAYQACVRDEFGARLNSYAQGASRIHMEVRTKWRTFCRLGRCRYCTYLTHYCKARPRCQPS